ncbi:MAG: hypothetical protein JOZ41_12620 [Chloroflexi bacterium]|nr:hypothetical protein [Chloroflexota bacterium]
MGLALRTAGASIRLVSGRFTTAVLVNLTATILSLPIVALVGVAAVAAHSVNVVLAGLVLLIVILPNPLAAGLHHVIHELARGEPVYLSEQFDGLRRYGLPALKAWLMSLPVTVLIVFNLAFYGAAHVPFAGPLTIIWVYILLTWLSVHLYVYPLLMEQDVPRLFLLYRNAFIMTVSRPLFTLVVVPIWLAVVVVCVATGLAAVFGLALAAAMQHIATLRVLPTFARR